ncbi:MAG: glycosyltransferase [Actinomycetota bacterium]|nr:glycosyltransferase [Actinomycetota bacterium]
MADVPPEVERLVREREERRRARDFTAADRLRRRIRELGFDVEDSPAGSQVTPVSAPRLPRVTPDQVPSVLEQPPSFDVTVQWLVQGWPGDVLRGIDGFRRLQGERSVQHVVVDAAETDPASWPPDVEVVPLDRDHGWGTGRNVGLKRTAGRMVVVADGSVEPTGDVLGPLERALKDPAVGLAGPFGIVTDDLDRFEESEGPDVDAIEGYLVAARREALVEAGGFDERFRFYRAADIELSFRVKDRGLRCVVVPVPLARHEHRMWANTPAEERDRLSERNFNRFLDRWRGRLDLCVAHRHPEPTER